MIHKLIEPIEVARLAGFSVDTVRLMAKRGVLPGAIFVGRNLRFDPEKLQQFFEAGGSRPRQDAEVLTR